MNIGEKLLLVIAISSVFRQSNALCGPQHLTEWTGVLASPGTQSGIYDNNLDCEWEIKVTRGSKVNITFQMFDLEEGAMSRDSKNKLCLDYVKVEDSSGQILYECGALDAPLEVMSSSETVKVIFHSDESGAGKGFKAVYTGVCELDIATNFLLATPNYPSSPPLGAQCLWNVGDEDSEFQIVKAVTPAKLPAGGTVLPDCGSSPLKILTSLSPGDARELCMQEPRQAYTGSITIMYDSASPSSETWTGQLEIQFTDNMDCSQFCVHSSGCSPVVRLTKLEFNCQCLPGYDGVTCEHRKDICLTDPCGQNNPTPNCPKDPESISGGVWRRPNLFLCVSPDMKRILQDAETFVKNVSKVFSDQLSNITSRLVATTNLSVDSNRTWHELFPGDLSAVVDVLDMIAQVDQYAGSEVTDACVEDYIATVDNILDPKTADTWRNALTELVEVKVSKVIESTQMFISKFLTNKLSLRGLNLTVAEGGIDDFMNRIIFKKVVRNLGITVITGTIKGGVYGAFTNLAPTSSVVFPGLKFNSSDTSMPDVPITIYVARFSSVSPLLSISDSRYNKESQNDSTIINSDVLSVEFLNISNLYFQNLIEPVTLTFSLQDPNLRRNSVQQCVYMNMTASSHSERWPTSGCKVAEYNSTHVVCQCDHLTNFAVLMDIYNTQDSMDSSNKVILTYISYIGGSLSILACVTTIIVFHYFRIESDRIRIHQQLSLSIILVQILFICVGKTGKESGTPLKLKYFGHIKRRKGLERTVTGERGNHVWKEIQGTISAKTDAGDTLGRKVHEIACRILATLLHYCLTAMFCWMLVEGIHLYIILVRVFKRGFHFRKYLLVGWGTPLVMVGVSLGAFHDKYGVGNVCWLSHEVLLVCFVPAVALVVTINTVILALVIRLMIKSNNSTYKFQTLERSNIRLGVKAAVVLLPLLGLTWILGFLAVNTDQTEMMSYVFTYLFTISNSFQGVLFFIFHCLLNFDVRQAFERRYNRGKRSSCAETTSSRLRKFSDQEVSYINTQRVYSKDTSALFSILNSLSPIALKAIIPSPVDRPVGRKSLEKS